MTATGRWSPVAVRRQADATGLLQVAADHPAFRQHRATGVFDGTVTRMLLLIGLFWPQRPNWRYYGPAHQCLPHAHEPPVLTPLRAVNAIWAISIFLERKWDSQGASQPLMLGKSNSAPHQKAPEGMLFRSLSSHAGRTIAKRIKLTIVALKITEKSDSSV